MFKQRLKQLREDKKISQAELARELNVAQGTIGNWETGKRTPDINTLKVIANYFNVTIDYLMENENSTKKSQCLSRLENVSLSEEKDKQLLQFINIFLQQKED